MKIIKVLTDFSETPGPRYIKQGPDSGELFYHQKLNEAFAEAVISDDQLQIDLDGTDGYMSSFLDEAIGNLVYDFGEELVQRKLQITSNEEKVWIDLIKKNIIPEWGKRLKEKLPPQKTSKEAYTPWYRLVDGQLERSVWINASV